MSWSRVGIGVTTAAAGAATLLATSTIWLLLSRPATVATAVDQGTIAPVARELAAALIDVLHNLLAYL